MSYEERCGEQGHILSSYVKHGQHAAKIKNVESIE